MPQKDTNKAVISRTDSERKHNRVKGINHLFVIAIDDYEYCPKLYNCLKDAKALIKILTEQYEFEQAHIQTLFNQEATEGNIFKAFRTLITKVTPEDNVIIYFSGHGEYDEVFDEGYWIPINAKLGAHEDFVPNSKIKNILEAIKSKHIFLIADSCFSGSLFTQFKSTAVAERLENAPSRWGLTAGRNEVVSDGQVGDHSPFADSLLYHLKNNKAPLGVATLCNRVIENVVAAAEQTPRGEPLKVKGHRGGQFFFHPRGFQKGNPIHQTGNGSILYQIPAQMELGQDTKCLIRIAFEEATLRKALDLSKEATIQSIRVSQLMEVELIDPLTAGNFQIRAINEQEQIIDENDFTQWLFYVNPKKAGKFPLFLKVTLIELVYGKERKKEIVLEETIHVVNQLTTFPTETFKNAGYSLSFSLANVKGLGGQLSPISLPTENAGKKRYQPPIDKPTASSSKPANLPSDSNKKSTSPLYKILGGIAAALLFLVIGNNVLTSNFGPVPGAKPNITAPDKEAPQPTAPITVPKTTTTDLSKRTLRKVYNPNGNGKIGFKDTKSNKLAIAYQYDMVVAFKGPSTFVKKGNKWALIDKKGEYLVKFRIKQPGIFRDGYADIIPEGFNRVIQINQAGEVKIKGVFYKLDDYLDRRLRE